MPDKQNGGAMTDYEALSDLELLDLGLTDLGIPVLPNYFDDTHARRIRDRIAELGLIEAFMQELSRMVYPKTLRHMCFSMMQSTPRQQMIAALKAKEGSNG